MAAPCGLVRHGAGHDVEVQPLGDLGGVEVGDGCELLEAADALGLELKQRLLRGQADVVAALQSRKGAQRKTRPNKRPCQSAGCRGGRA